jgi:hypothetical protein
MVDEAIISEAYRETYVWSTASEEVRPGCTALDREQSSVNSKVGVRHRRTIRRSVNCIKVKVLQGLLLRILQRIRQQNYIRYPLDFKKVYKNKPCLTGVVPLNPVYSKMISDCGLIGTSI